MTLRVPRRRVPHRLLAPQAAALAVAFIAAGCATTAQDCDPRKVSNVFSALSCNVSGGFDAHLQAARDEVEGERARLAAARQQKRNLEQTNVALTTERANLNQKLAHERRENDRVRLQLSSMRITNDRERARVEALREQLTIAERNLTSMQQSGATAAEISRLEAENADIRKAIKTMTERARQE